LEIKTLLTNSKWVLTQRAMDIDHVFRDIWKVNELARPGALTDKLQENI
jgi:hypothetical protein